MPAVNAKGLIVDEQFHRILNKLHGESSCRQLHFYNWSEPLLHPRIVQYCRVASDLGFHVHLSSNLNRLRDAEGLLDAGVKTLRVSLSGFTQEVYEKGHRGGDVELVKANMHRLRDARRRTGSNTRLQVYYLKYRHNLHEVSLMRQFAENLGFTFASDWAFYTPLERMFEYVEGGLSAADRRFADEAIVPAMSSAVALMQGRRHRSCEAVNQLVLDWQGNVMLCCALYSRAMAGLGRHQQLNWRRIQEMRYGHEICSKCMHYGVHVLYMHYHVPELRAAMEDLAEASLTQEQQEGGDERTPTVGLGVRGGYSPKEATP
ncbi:MAG: radical SAM protein [Phycisphaerales bacterium]|nr:MAG: radical SAM protein [Phycisphaerales bacterium]